jgi:Ala-tRNA(Pro) deacylase
MAVPKKITKYLDSADVKYEIIQHRIVYTAYDKAETLKIPAKQVGKTLVVKINGGFAFVLIPASRNLDKGKFKKVVNQWRKKKGEKVIKNINFVKEAWMKKKLVGVKIGAVPPFGNLWGLPTFAERAIMKNPKIIIPAGNYQESIKITPADFKKLVPDLIIGNFSKKR